ncbi:unnamed protein product [Paramecium sonneborni]|uniref:Transmembrane protein n=1 Tax=Paramecium sonneborni TaxID=65129 RepID=A0A8S1RSC2_9CILI|nr:unnamed protein product [Paramecium sonneborni]
MLIMNFSKNSLMQLSQFSIFSYSQPLSMRACFVIDFEQVGPFEKSREMFYIIFSSQQFSFSFEEPKQQLRSLIQSQLSSLVLTRYFLQEAFYLIGKITQASFLLLISPVKFVCDAFKDWAVRKQNPKFKLFLTKYCCLPSIAIYDKTKQIEEVLYVELVITKKQNVMINVCLKFIDYYLELSEDDSNTAELFEQIRNTVDSFLLITQIFISLLCAIVCKAILSIKYLY